MSSLNPKSLYTSIIQGEAKALAKAITLLESSLETHQEIANELLDLCLSHTGNSLRIGVTGVPGVGKSTFIDAFGDYLISEQHKKVAVLAIDPSSQRTKGSILGDKTRMNRLSNSEHAFVRPSPSGDTLGGVASQTRESILLCEAAGFDIVMVETVGVGQSETLVHEMVDFFLLLLLPGAGDELQGIKRGIVEMADMIAINKSDTNNQLAKEAKLHYKNALHLTQSGRQDWEIPVETIDSISGVNLETVSSQLELFISSQRANGSFELNRKKQTENWLTQHIEHVFLQFLKHDAIVQKKLTGYRKLVADNAHSPRSAANKFLKEVLGKS
ncbi:MAG: LAO/AO transport system kinase [bacterium]|jgi:LAO/AO transport system kinase